MVVPIEYKAFYTYFVVLTLSYKHSNIVLSPKRFLCGLFHPHNLPRKQEVLHGGRCGLEELVFEDPVLHPGFDFEHATHPTFTNEAVS